MYTVHVHVPTVYCLYANKMEAQLKNKFKLRFRLIRVTLFAKN